MTRHLNVKLHHRELSHLLGNMENIQFLNLLVSTETSKTYQFGYWYCMYICPS